VLTTQRQDVGQSTDETVASRSWRSGLRWTLGVLSFGVTLGRAIQTALTVHQLDLAVYLMGARQLFTGHLYSTTLAGSGLPFTYPPVAALLFVPVTVLPPTGASVMWAVVSTIALLGLLGVSLRAVRPTWPRARVIGWALILSYPAMVLNPVALSFSFGQINVLLAILVLTDLTMHFGLRGHRLPRGVMVGLATAVKLTPGIFVPYLFLTRQIRAGWTAVITFLVATLALVMLAPSESWAYWTRDVFDVRRVGGTIYVSNQSLRSTLARFGHGHSPGDLSIAVILAVAVGGLAIAVWADRGSSRLLGILVCAVTGLLVSPITWTHHLVWVVPVLLWLALADDRPAFGRIWAAFGAVWFWWGAIFRVPNGSGRELHDTITQLLLANSYTLLMVGFLVGVAVMLWWRGRGKADGRGESTDPGRTRRVSFPAQSTPADPDTASLPHSA